ncbi:ATP-binding protein [Amycolatopsis alba]|uniref:NB-ARC domain-containing protein n=1 Tax=Amycolatopsis alba DSM 44262 TaxID=1125972 RepID=A0A229S7J0_AMYAL|nr:tetratricopeptide repeat protein [Amycolatopsis alba]OXM54886.1 hypothetical protein CFP75_01695 [Amycolatopsis alba DSM 44262]
MSVSGPTGKVAMVAGRGSRHHLIVVADVEGFGDPRRTGPHQQAVRDGLYEVMAAAFAAAGLVWENCYREDRGDAVFVLVPPETDKAAFVETVFPALVTRLRVHNDSHPEMQRIRLRIALHAGEVGYDEHGVTSSSLTLAFRLCDAPPLRTALDTSPGVLAVIASDRLFDDVVRHTPAAAPETWRPVTVAVKEAATAGWIALPDHPYPPEPGSRASGIGRPGTGVIPRQLPAAVRDFTGRAEHLTALDALIPPDPGTPGERAQSVVITAVDGTGGIGKTSLALHWAHRVQDRFPDGTLHVNLRGYGSGEPATPGEALGGFLRALGVAARAIPADVEAQAASLRSLLAGKRVLMLLDNAHSAEQVRPLLPASPGCMVVVTSRDCLTGLVVTDAAHRLTLDLLTSSEALDLVAGIIGPRRADDEAEAVGELVKWCARLPLALRIAASRVAVHPHRAVADVVAELADDRTRLDALSESSDEPAAIRAVFAWSYRRLPAEQARLFRRLGLHPGPDLSLPAAAALAELPPAHARPLMTALAEAHLVEPISAGRYRLHDLLRAYAAEQAGRFDTAEERLRTLNALLTWYSHTARTADHRLHPAFMKIPAVVTEPAHPHPITGRGEAWAWLIAERINLQAALQHAADHQLNQHTIPLAHACRFLLSAGSPQEQIDALNLGINAARQSGTRTQEATLVLTRAEAVYRLGRLDHAKADLDRADTLLEHLDDDTLTVYSLNSRGLILLHQNRFEDAERYLLSALPLSRGIDTGRWEAVVEGNLSAARCGLGDHQCALVHGERSLRLRRKAGDLTGEAGALTQIARIWQGMRAPYRAIALCLDAIAIGRRTPLNRDDTLAEPLEVIGICQYRLGNTDEALTYWQEAANLYDNIGLPRKAADVRRRATQLKKEGRRRDAFGEA